MGGRVRRRRGHPWLFCLAVGTGVTSLLAGDVIVAALMTWAAVMLVIR